MGSTFTRFITSVPGIVLIVFIAVILIAILGFIIYKFIKKKDDKKYEDGEETDYEEDREYFNESMGKAKTF